MELKLCPFCGGEELNIVPAMTGFVFFKVYWVGCECGCSGPMKKRKKDAMSAWNTRHE